MACRHLKAYAQARLDHFKSLGERGEGGFAEDANYSISVIDFAEFLPNLEWTMEESFKNIDRTTLNAQLKKVKAKIIAGYNAYEAKILEGGLWLDKAAGVKRQPWKDLPSEWTTKMMERRDAAKGMEVHAIIAGKFTHLDSFKRHRKKEENKQSGLIVKAVEEVFDDLRTKNEALFEHELGKMGGRAKEKGPGGRKGTQAGHGAEGDPGAAGLKVLKQEAMTEEFTDYKNLSAGERATVKTITDSYKSLMEIDISADSVYNSNGTGKSTFHTVVKAEAAITNQAQSLREKSMHDQYTKHWEVLANMECPSSIYELYRNTVIYNLTAPVKDITTIIGDAKAERIAIQHAEDKGEKYIPSKVKVNKWYGGVTVARAQVERMLKKSGSGTPNKATGVSNAPLALLGMFQTQLPDVVRKNMGPPRLTNRKGTFADSVKVPREALITTPQGFPSFGFTYQRNPYQTFEPGGAQGSTNYDPRTLIESSMREIAAKQAMGRFYTRRV
jgi:hypothetical protein